MSLQISLFGAALLLVSGVSHGAAYLTAYRPPVLKQSVNCPSMDNGQFNHPSFCDQYLNCWEGEAVIGQCPPGLLFNEMNSACDYPQNVNCEGRGSSRPPAAVSEDCPELDGIFPSRKNCSEFIICQNGNPTVKSCPEELHYDEENKICVYQRDSNCQQMGGPDSGATPAPPAGAGPTQSPGAGGGPPDEILKPPFSPLPPSESTETPSNPPSLPEQPPSPPPTDINQVLWPAWPNWPSTTKCPIIQGFLPVMGQCESVVVCIGGFGQLLRCPAGHSFDLSLGRCSASRMTQGCIQNAQPVGFNRALSTPDTFIGNPFGGVVQFIYYPQMH